MLDKVALSCTVNGDAIEAKVAPFATLLEFLRDELELTGTKEACGEGECGACSMLLDGKLVNACLVPALECEGADILTIEGLESGGNLESDQGLHPIQQAFVDHGAVQCGYCTPGMVMATYALLTKNPSPNEDEIKRALEGNLCRCTGYRKIIDAVQSLAKGGVCHG